MRVPTWCVHNIIMMSNALVKISLVSLSLSPHQLSPSDTAHPEHAPKADEKAAARWGVWPAPQGAPQLVRTIQKGGCRMCPSVSMVQVEAVEE